eukprot:gene26448-33027_t
MRCGNGFDTSVNCGDATAFVTKVQQSTSDKIVYIATNEPQNSSHMDTIRAAGFQTLSSVGGGEYQKLDQLSVLTMEVSLMLQASTFLAWGISEIDDVVEYERKMAGLSFCTAHEHYVVKNGNLTFCHVDAEERAKALTAKISGNQPSQQVSISSVQSRAEQVHGPAVRHKLIIIQEVPLKTATNNNSTVSSPPPPGPSNSGPITAQTVTVATHTRVSKIDGIPSNPPRSVSELLITTNSDTFALRKTAFSNRSRLLFVAGLEGTGHHAVQAMFKVCNATKICEFDALITHHAMRFDGKAQSNHGLFGASDAVNNAKDAVVIEEAMRSLVATPGDHFYFLGLGFVPGSGMLSYPNFNGRHKSLDHPDAYTLALMAESAGLDFRVLVLQRDAADIIASTAKRGFGGALGAAGEPKILIDNAAVLYSQLALLDPAFIHCVQYKTLGNLSAEARDEMVDFLHPVLMKSELAVMLKEVVYSRPTLPSGALSVLSGASNVGAISRTPPRKPKVVVSAPLTPKQQENLEYHIKQLSSRLALIDNVCKKQQ